MTPHELTTTAGMTERAFGIAFAKLAVQLRFADADEVTIRAYYEALRDLPLPAIQDSGVRFAREAGRKYFPTSAEWHEAASTLAVQHLRETLPPARAQGWQVECAACDDTGWMPFACPGDASCGRERRHAAHSYVRVCPCRPTNRTWERHQRFGSGA